MSWNDIVITSLQHHFRFLPYKTQKNFITSAFPQRNVPLLDADVFSETQGGAIYGVALVKQPSYARILSYNLPFTISFLWSLFATIWVGTGLNSRMIGLIWVWLTSIMVASTCRIVQIERPGAIWKLIRDRYSSMLTKLLTKEQPLQVGFIRLTFFCVSSSVCIIITYYQLQNRNVESDSLKTSTNHRLT